MKSLGCDDGADDGGLPEELIARAEKAAAAVVARLARTYPQNALAELALAKGALDGIADASIEASRVYETVHGVAHVLKGQGTTFGYPFVTAIAESLCDYLRTTPDAVGDKPAVCLAHLSALTAVLQGPIAGDSDERGKTLVRRMAALSSAQSI